MATKQERWISENGTCFEHEGDALAYDCALRLRSIFQIAIGGETRHIDVGGVVKLLTNTVFLNEMRGWLGQYDRLTAEEEKKTP